MACLRLPLNGSWLLNSPAFALFAKSLRAAICFFVGFCAIYLRLPPLSAATATTATATHTQGELRSEERSNPLLLEGSGAPPIPIVGVTPGPGGRKKGSIAGITGGLIASPIPQFIEGPSSDLLALAPA